MAPARPDLDGRVALVTGGGRGGRRRLACRDQRDRGERVTQVAAMAKTFATDAAMEAATEAVQIHGARGYSKD